MRGGGQNLRFLANKSLYLQQAFFFWNALLTYLLYVQVRDSMFSYSTFLAMMQ